MRVIILLISCGFALLTFLISLIAYPLIASAFDFNPFALCLIIGIPLLIATFFVTINVCKEKFIRLSIIIPCFASILLSIIITGIKFNVYNEYVSGYIEGYGHSYGVGPLYNSFGFCIVHRGHEQYYSGVDEYGNEVIIGANIDYDYEYDNEKWERYKFTLNYFDTQGNFLNSKEFSLKYSIESYSNGFYSNYKEDIKYYAKKYNNVTIYERIS